ncbi:hypothetical protein UY3_14525 [Chelonia mydas]|uniref:Uncharacterized protein n=1 Tax=Chelonia mydas TaxID=8469 RepID=M7B870_CHEMY|nr:hypothetical protein UY3_14525 [Chelonia mydas]
MVSNVVGTKRGFGEKRRGVYPTAGGNGATEVQITNQAATQAYAQDKLEALRQDFQAERAECTHLKALAKKVPVFKDLSKDLTIRVQHTLQRQCAHHEKEIKQLNRQLAVCSVQVASLTGDESGDPCEGFDIFLCEDPQFWVEPCCTPIVALNKTKERSSG